jgi:hypothetical protein
MTEVRLLTTSEAASLLGAPVGTLRYWCYLDQQL